MPDFSISSILDWLNSNGAVVSLCTAAFGFWGGLRTNLLTARRAEWNAVVDRIRPALLRCATHEMPVGEADMDLLLQQAGWRMRRRIQGVWRSHSEINRQHHRDEWGACTHPPEQIAEMRELRDQMLILLKRK